MKNEQKNVKSWLEKIPWLSLFLLFLTYAVFGWSISKQSHLWKESILDMAQNFGFSLEDDLIMISIHVLALAIIVLIALLLTTPITLVTFVYKESIGSNIKAVISVFIWSFVLVMILCFFDHFANLLVMISAAILVRLDLQKMGYKVWQVFFIIGGLAIIGFALGIISFELKNSLILNRSFA